MWKISYFCDELMGPFGNFEDSLELMRRHGIEYIDLRCVDGPSFLELDDDELDRVQSLLVKYGLRVAGLGAPLFKCSLRGREGPPWGSRHGFRDHSYEEHLELLPRAFQIADRFGAANVRCFSFWREAEPDEAFDEVVDKLGAAARRASELGYALAMENEHDTMAGTGIEAARILRAVNSPCLTSIYDAGNSARRGGIPYPNDYEALKGLITHVQIKHEGIGIVDNMHGWNDSNLPIEGRIHIANRTVQIAGRFTLLPVTQRLFIDYLGLLSALRADGYAGFINVDTGDNSPDYEANLQRTVPPLKATIAELWDNR